MWDDLKYFINAADSGSFSEAAVKLQVSVATVSRRVEALEKQLGLRLLDRQVSGVSLTAEGQRIHQATASAADQLSQVPRLAAALQQGVDVEPVVISSTEPIIADILAPHLPELWRHNPDIRPTLSVATANISIAHRDADIAIRLARPQQDNVVIKRLPAIRMGLFASATYLRGRQVEAISLSDETLLGMDNSFGDIPEASWFTEQSLQQQKMLASSSVRALSNAARAGCGVALIPSFTARAAGLIEIPVKGLPSRSPYLAFHKDYRHVKRIKLAKDWIIDAFNKAL